MPSYLVETYLAQGNSVERTAREARARSVAEELTREGTSVRFQRAFHLPADEICLRLRRAVEPGRRGVMAERQRSTQFGSSKQSLPERKAEHEETETAHEHRLGPESRA